MRVQCPSCKQALSAPEDALGRKARCKGCGNYFVIEPSHVAPPPEPVAPPKGPDLAPAPTCPQCRNAMESTASVCACCGYNLQTGATVMASVSKPVMPPEPEEQEERPSPAVRLIEFIGELMPGLFRPWMLILSILIAAVGFVVMGFCVALLLLGTVVEAMMVGGFGLIIYGQAIAIILQGEWGLLHELLAELDGRRWALFFFLLFAPFGLLYLAIRPMVQ